MLIKLSQKICKRDTVPTSILSEEFLLKRDLIGLLKTLLLSSLEISLELSHFSTLSILWKTNWALCGELGMYHISQSKFSWLLSHHGWLVYFHILGVLLSNKWLIYGQKKKEEFVLLIITIEKLQFGYGIMNGVIHILQVCLIIISGEFSQACLQLLWLQIS